MVISKQWIRFSYKYVILFLLTLLFIPSPYLQTFFMFNKAYLYLRVAAAPVIMVMWFRKAPLDSIRWITLAVGIYLWMTIVTYVRHNGSSYVTSGLVNLLIAAAFFMLIDMYLRMDYFQSLRTIRLAMELLFWINFASVILHPNGLYIAVESNANIGYFLGMRNNTIEVVLPFLGILLLETYAFNKNIAHFLVCTGAALATYLISSSVNSLLCIIVFIAYGVFFFYRKKIAPYLKVNYYLLASALITVLLSAFRLNRYFEFFISRILEKSVTFSNRMTIWERSIHYIRKSPVIGYGIESNNIKYLKIHALNSCHNYFFDFLYYGGVILLVLVLILIIITVSKMYKNNKPKVSEILSITFASYFVLWIATPIHRNTLCYMFAFWLIAYKCKTAKPGFLSQRNRNITFIKEKKTVSLTIR